LRFELVFLESGAKVALSNYVRPKYSPDTQVSTSKELADAHAFFGKTIAYW